jgi:hypothetical protein
MIGETARAFFAENATSDRTRKAMAADGIDRPLWKAFCQELGLSGIGIPESTGGAGLGLVELAIIAEAAGAQVAALPMLGSLALSAQAVASGGSAEQKAAYLPGLLSGDIIAGYVHDAALSGRGQQPDRRGRLCCPWRIGAAVCRDQQQRGMAGCCRCTGGYCDRADDHGSDAALCPRHTGWCAR